MCGIVTKEFKIVGVRNKGLFEDYAEIVPKAAQQFLQRANGILYSTGTEVTVYEPKKGESNAEGTFFVGLLVNEKMDTLPEGLEYLNIQHSYAMIKGKDSGMEKLYTSLDQWIECQSYQKDTAEHFIIEVYYPTQTGGEEVEIYIPVKNS